MITKRRVALVGLAAFTIWMFSRMDSLNPAELNSTQEKSAQDNARLQGDKNWSHSKLATAFVQRLKSTLESRSDIGVRIASMHGQVRTEGTKSVLLLTLILRDDFRKSGRENLSNGLKKILEIAKSDISLNGVMEIEIVAQDSSGIIVATASGTFPDPTITNF